MVANRSQRLSSNVDGELNRTFDLMVFSVFSDRVAGKTSSDLSGCRETVSCISVAWTEAKLEFVKAFNSHPCREGTVLRWGNKHHSSPVCKADDQRLILEMQ